MYEVELMGNQSTDHYELRSCRKWHSQFSIIKTSRSITHSRIINAPAVILAHNHPSGVPTPSNSDIQFTKRIQQAAELLDIKVLDHIVIGQDGFVSLNKKGLM